jgi:tetratricopeptide (TPR) repeat protein
MLPKRAGAERGHHQRMGVGQAGKLREQVDVARLRLADIAAALGAVLGVLGEHTEAEALLRQAIGIYETSCGTDDPRLAAPLNALGAACAARGRLAEAEQLYHRALHIINPRALEQR